MTITDRQARAIAYLIHEIRPDWGIASLESLIDKHRDVPSLGALAVAAATKAMEANCKTPAPIFHPGPHWPEKARASLPKPPPCPDHIGQDGHTCRSCHADVKAGIRPDHLIGKHHEPESEDDARPIPNGRCSTYCWPDTTPSGKGPSPTAGQEPSTSAALRTPAKR